MTNFTGIELELAKRWMISLLSWGDAIKNDNYHYFLTHTFDNDYAKNICNEIKYRNWNFFSNKLDDCLAKIAAIRIDTPSGGAAKRSPEWCADVIAWFCSENGIRWDDSNKTTYEIDAVKDTVLGKALFEAGCFLHSKPVPQPAQQTAAKVPPTQTSQPPKSGYKSSGGHSQDIPNLVNNNKVYLIGPIYCITADKNGKNTPRAFITPLSVVGNNIRTVSNVQAEKIKFGSGNGYTDCTLFFDLHSDAVQYEAACKATFGSKFNNIHIEMNKNADKNGYFRVKTEINDYAYIKASVLNEEFEEDLEADTKKPQHINDIEVYDEWMRKSIS